MEIEIKKIKIFISFTCGLLFIFIGYYVFASVGDASLETYDDISSIDPSSNLTLKFANELRPLAINDDGTSKAVSVSDIDGAIQSSLGDSLSDNKISIDSLPEFSIPTEKIIKQQYGNLTPEERKSRVKSDIANYLGDLLYLFMSNSPQQISSAEDFKKLVETTITHLGDLYTSSGPNYAYYNKLRPGIEIFVEQASEMDVPEDMVNVHVKGIRIIKAFLALRDEAPAEHSIADPVANINFITKVRSLIQFSVEYLKESAREIEKSISQA